MINPGSHPIGRKLMLKTNILSYDLDDEIHLRIPGAGHVFHANKLVVANAWQGMNSYLSRS